MRRTKPPSISDDKNGRDLPAVGALSGAQLINQIVLGEETDASPAG